MDLQGVFVNIGYLVGLKVSYGNPIGQALLNK